MEVFRQCVGCQAKAPKTDTAHTLIGDKHGWRLARAVDAHGMVVMQWRCRSCWQKFKAFGGSESTGRYAAVSETECARTDSDKPRVG